MSDDEELFEGPAGCGKRNAATVIAEAWVAKNERLERENAVLRRNNERLCKHLQGALSMDDALVVPVKAFRRWKRQAWGLADECGVTDDRPAR